MNWKLENIGKKRILFSLAANSTFLYFKLMSAKPKTNHDFPCGVMLLWGCVAMLNYRYVEGSICEMVS